MVGGIPYVKEFNCTARFFSHIIATKLLQTTLLPRWCNQDRGVDHSTTCDDFLTGHEATTCPTRSTTQKVVCGCWNWNSWVKVLQQFGIHGLIILLYVHDYQLTFACTCIFSLPYIPHICFQTRFAQEMIPSLVLTIQLTSMEKVQNLKTSWRMMRTARARDVTLFYIMHLFTTPKTCNSSLVIHHLYIQYTLYISGGGWCSSWTCPTCTATTFQQPKEHHKLWKPHGLQSKS